ncbi:putative UDP-glucosyl transferase 88A1 [Hibiscus syriacus]|uniref:UDP-glucosyl transferase 88A1 n=1 Tax=Hibiscus syriacus TaxID=106335 RepID=A0A6A2ZY12_HIBSY|nr:putative UDP-glucosyl transferase 88A1 [Hibiscus syriacus]
MAYLPILTTSDAAKLTNGADNIEIPWLTPLPISSIPPPFFTRNALSNQKQESFKQSPTDSPYRPLESYELNIKQARYLPWLNHQPVESVVLLSCGSRTAMSKDQIKELRDGLDKSGHRFIWDLKTKKVLGPSTHPMAQRKQNSTVLPAIQVRKTKIERKICKYLQRVP